jgi:hypothetical protein
VANHYLVMGETLLACSTACSLCGVLLSLAIVRLECIRLQLEGQLERFFALVSGVMQVALFAVAFGAGIRTLHTDHKARWLDAVQCSTLHLYAGTNVRTLPWSERNH